MDPLTVAAAIAGIISAIKGIIDASATAEWQKSVSGKIDTIILQNATIISDLEKLPLLFAIDLQAAFNSEVAIQGISLSNSFDQYMKGRHPDVGQIRNIRTPSEVITNNIVQRGPCVYQATNALTALVLAIHKILHVDHNETQALVENVLTHMKVWAGNDAGMFGNALNHAFSLLQNAKDTLGHEPRGAVEIYSVQTTVVLPGGSHGNGIHMHTTLKVIADITIDDNNLTFTLNNPRSTWFDTTRIDDSVVAGQAAVRAARIQSEIDTIKQIQARANTLRGHEQALQQMIGILTNWR